MAYTLITANRNYSSWSLRPWLLMRALGIPFDDRKVLFGEGDNWRAFRQFSPTGQVPVLIDDHRTIHDSLGIALYLADRHAGIWPDDPAAKAWAQAVVCEMHGGFGALRNQCGMSIGVRVRLRQHDAALDRDVGRIAEIFADGLARFGGPWLAGDKFTIADAFYAPVACRVRTYGLDVGAGQPWVETLLAHPAFRVWEAEALAETSREPGHEADVAAVGAIVADYRAHAAAI